MEIHMIIVLLYLFFHIPAFILLFFGLRRLKTKPEGAKEMLIAAGIYFIVGGGICGALLT